MRLLDADLRANPAYELVLLDRLAPADRAALKGAADDPELYGVLRPRAGEALAIQTVTRDLALLFLTLERRGKLPEYVRRELGDAAAETLLRFVSDGVLEVWDGDRFVSGPDALAFAREPPRFRGASRVAALSTAALEHATRLDDLDAGRLAGALYRFNTAPRTPRRAIEIADVPAYVGLDSPRVVEALAADWIPASSNRSGDGAWLAWSRRGVEPSVREVVYKLYWSPTIDAVPAALSRFLTTLGNTTSFHFKMGRDLPNVLRPDKVVAYFDSMDSLRAAAEAMGAAIACDAQGVPFTGPIDDRGLFSWGLDPRPAGAAPPEESWRAWVVERLAVALAAAKRSSGAAMTPAEFAIERLELEGFDTASWTPSPRIWRDAPCR